MSARVPPPPPPHSSQARPLSMSNCYFLIEGADVVRFIMAQRIKWLGHMQRMDKARPNRKLLDWRPM
jgi:hypothetical protein